MTARYQLDKPKPHPLCLKMENLVLLEQQWKKFLEGDDTANPFHVKVK